MSGVDRAIAAQKTLGFVKLIAGLLRLLRDAGGSGGRGGARDPQLT